MIPKIILNVQEAYAIGGYDAGLQMKVFYPTAAGVYPLLPDVNQIVILPDNPASSWGLAWFMGLTQDPDLRPQFIVRDDVVLNTKIAWHESGHAFEALWVKKYVNLHRELNDYQAMDVFRTRYWNFRGFPGTWQEATDTANGITGFGGWSYYPGESLAEAFSAAVGGYVQSEWTATYGKDLALAPGNIYDPSGGGMRARQFFLDQMKEVDMDEAAIRQIALGAVEEGVIRALTNFGLDGPTFVFLKDRLAKDAHHKHGVTTSNGQATDMGTTEPREV